MPAVQAENVNLLRMNERQALRGDPARLRLRAEWQEGKVALPADSLTINDECVGRRAAPAPARPRNEVAHGDRWSFTRGVLAAAHAVSGRTLPYRAFRRSYYATALTKRSRTWRLAMSSMRTVGIFSLALSMMACGAAEVDDDDDDAVTEAAALDPSSVDDDGAILPGAAPYGCTGCKLLFNGINLDG